MTDRVIYCLKGREAFEGTFAPDCLVITDQTVTGQQAATDGAVCIAVAGEDLPLEGFYPWAELLIEDLSELDGELLEQTWCHGKGLPWRVTVGERIYLQELTVADVPALYRIYHQKSVLEQVQEMTGTLPEERQKMEAYQSSYRFYGHGIWGIFRIEDDLLLGSCGLEWKEWNGESVLELGYVLDEAVRGQGYATEAAHLALDIGHRMGYERIHARIAPENEPSQAVAERIGMRRTGNICLDGKRYLVYQKARKGTFN